MTHQIILLLQINLTRGPGGEFRQMTIPQKPDGAANNIEPGARKRIIDLRNGNHFFSQGKNKRAQNISAYPAVKCNELSQSLRNGFA